MDAFLKDIEKLSDFAGKTPVAPSLNSFALMAKIRALPSQNQGFEFSLRAFLGTGVAAAAATIAVIVYSLPAWAELDNPFMFATYFADMVIGIV